jgi:myo-inositol-1(or 4)-monophosphatase
MPALNARFAAAQALVREAGSLARRIRNQPAAEFGVEQKSELDFATEADRALERLVIEQLAGRVGDGILGEEYGGSNAERLWVVDPIDGTFNYMHHLPVWCISLAYLEAGEIQLGIIYNPDTGELFTAQKGRGASLNGNPIRVSNARHAAPLVEIGASNRRPLPDYLALIGRCFAAGCEFRRLGSGAMGLAAVACGRTDGYLELHINSWDVCAGILLVREAGGWTSDFLAGEGLTQGNPIIACTPELRDRLSAMLPLAG